MATITLFILSYFRTLKDYYIIRILGDSHQYIEKISLNSIKDSVLPTLAPLYTYIYWQKLHRLGIHIAHDYGYHHYRDCYALILEHHKVYKIKEIVSSRIKN